MPSRPCTAIPMFSWTLDTRPEDVIEFHRLTFGSAVMEASDGGDGGDPSGDGGDPSGDGGDEPQTLEEVMAELGLTPDQLRGRLEASKKWERRVRASDRVDREDYERVKNELATFKQASETEQERAVREARDAGRIEARKEASEDSARLLLKVALRDRQMADDDIDEAIDTLNLSAFLNADGDVDDDKVIRAANRLSGTGNGTRNPDTGQGRRQRITHKPGEAGRAEADRRFGKTADATK